MLRSVLQTGTHNYALNMKLHTYIYTFFIEHFRLTHFFAIFSIYLKICLYISKELSNEDIQICTVKYPTGFDNSYVILREIIDQKLMQKREIGV